MMIRRIHITIFLFLSTILFSSEYQQTIQNSLLKNEIMPQKIITSPSFKLYDFLIYPSHDAFKYTILPYLSSSEILLKCFFHFQKLHPTVNLEKFLPYSRIQKDVLDLQNSPLTFAYFFQNEYKFFNPILYQSKNNYTTCIMNDKYNIQGDSICALFSTNVIFFLKLHVLPDKREAYVAFDQNNEMFFVAIKTDNNQAGTLTAISNGIIKSKTEFPHYLDCILDAHNLSGFSNLYFKFYYFYNVTYFDFVMKPLLKYFNYIMDFLGDKMTVSNTFPKNVIFYFFFIVVLILSFILFYHVWMFPFHIISIPFEISSEINWNGFVCLPNEFLNFWMFPFFFLFSLQDLFCQINLV